MVSFLSCLLALLAVHWAVIVWRRWSIHNRTQRFVRDQRRKAGIPDSDKRPLSVAAADAAKQRQEAFQKQLQECSDVFGPAQPAPTAPTGTRAAHAPSRAPSGAQHAAIAPQRTALLGPRLHAYEPETFYGPLQPTPGAKRGHAETEPQRTTKRGRVEAQAAPSSRKRHADTAPEADGTRSADAREVRRKVESDEDSHDSASSSEMSVDAEEEPERAVRLKKRSVDTSDDHAPGDEWHDANGLRWRIGDDGVPRRAVLLVEMKPKFKMPRDTIHPDARAKVPTYTEKFLSHEEYEDAKRKKILSWQHQLAMAQTNAAMSPLSFESDDNVEDSLASLKTRRARGQARKNKGAELLFSEQARSPHSYAGSTAGIESFGTSLSDVSGGGDLSFSSSVGSEISSASGSRRLRLGLSPAPPNMLGQRYARIFAASPSPLSPARATLDHAARRKREEALMARIRADRAPREVAEEKTVVPTTAAPSAEQSVNLTGKPNTQSSTRFSFKKPETQAPDALSCSK
ncbi:hypothetical protein MVES1_001193 [Malassezia vespertilionis]|uniref:uncharacterized protein n=1 Tax=Malassezia vespertilionis TaxID=2020962 RepID=UPI0024B07AB0|nr:uncharacterized protein MVES1_001193 [Malassezia vespertilionis]WFD05859.1 hypothetical protein MVES1_001193 [Malassezia vespertilionis]